ncbi:helix-turn-helix domain-containing protein [Flavobacterium denitrificans]|uniref:helix-turn-helix domain-containing protein n=1 Tax=Flavobacterium denitrificans TaxID=281361 RepID=UPI00047BDB47|nr:helix-turn-helix transcriptional regulator [Flavobacterium denitrificans]
MYYEKLADYFKSKGLKQKEIAKILGISEQMTGRYLKGKDNMSSDLIQLIVQKFPEINLQYIFSNSEDDITCLAEPEIEAYFNVDLELKKIEEKIVLIRTHLARKGQDEK